MGKHFSTLVALFAFIILAGCQLPKPTSLATDTNASLIRNNCCSLLYDLLKDEKDVSILRFIRAERTDIKDLTKQIAAAAKAGSERLEEFAKQDPSLRLHDTALPPGEKATRDAIAKTKQKELLTLKGRDFELTLLLTQSEALNYGRHLAAVAAAYEPNPRRAAALTSLSREFEGLYRKVFDLEMAERSVVK